MQQFQEFVKLFLTGLDKTEMLEKEDIGMFWTVDVRV